MTDNLMVLGTGSGVGKSLVVTALGRWFQQQGKTVAPFKAQNMSNNATVAREGGEIAISQAIQAKACGQVPSIHHNPILLKPTAEQSSEVVVRGEVRDRMSWNEYREQHDEMKQVVLDSYRSLEENNDFVLMEGAGSPSEPNLKSHDLVNLPMAQSVSAPAIVVGDIRRGGVFAWLAGTLEWMSPSERSRIKGVVINRFRGNRDVLSPAIEQFEDRYQCPVLGVIPERDYVGVPSEDSLDATGRKITSHREDSLSVAVVHTRKASNLSDVQPLTRETDITLDVLTPGEIDDSYDLIILPGSKNTIGDLRQLKQEDWDQKLKAHLGRGGCVLGICGGYQMLGKTITDRNGVESDGKAVEGFGLLNIHTDFQRPKITRRVSGYILGNYEFDGYEIRWGRISVDSSHDTWVKTGEVEGPLGVYSGNVWGTSIHGILDRAGARRWFLNRIREVQNLQPVDRKDRTGDVFTDWSQHVIDHVDTDLLKQIVHSSAESVPV
ncbi:MAG: cobyric acid synthase [bacterium]